ncbi:YhiJ/YhiL family protein, partial [Escherichia coli]|uniref:YhiJ/YhiL family protein n=1 Tax=Escherichia coli TaxID=562 RepID=UPI000AB98516
HAFSSGAGRTSDGNGSHASTLKSPSYTKSVSWQHYRILNRRDIVLESLQPYLVINKDAVTPCTFLGDQTGDRFSNICGDKFIIDLLKRIMSINENVHVLAGNHETNCNGNYMQNFTRMKPLDEDTYAGIKDYPVCFYGPKYKIMANHHGITFDDQRKRYIIGPITVSSDEMTNALDPVELAAIINKKHHAVINGKKFKNSRAISCRSFNRYFSVSTDYRPKLEALLACSQMLGINQVVAHNGNGGRECIGETGTVLGLNARDSKHAGRMFSMHNCQINPGAGPEITTPWKSYQHEKNRNGLMPLIRRRTMLQL